MESATAIEKELDSITLGYSDGSKKKITGFKLGEVEDVKDATTAEAADTAIPDPSASSGGGGSKGGGKKSRKPKSKRIRVRKTRRRKH